MYDISITKVQHKNKAGKLVRETTGWRVHDGKFTIAVVPERNAAAWLAGRLNFAIERDRAAGNWVNRLRAWLGGLRKPKQQAVSAGNTETGYE